MLTGWYLVRLVFHENRWTWTNIIISGFWANGQENTGAVRAINSVNPVVDVNAPEMACGWGSGPAGSVAEVDAGSEVEWQLKNGEGGPWIHAKGYVFFCTEAKHRS